MSHQAAPAGRYVAVFAALLALTAITTIVSFQDLGPLNNLVALGIAVLKASLVVLYFMHAKESPRMTRLVIGAVLVWLLILIALTLGDYFSRGWLGAPNAAQAMTRTGS